MKTRKRSIGTTFILTSNWWIHLTTLTIITFLYYMTFNSNFGSKLVYLNAYKWTVYFKILSMTILIFSPALLYSIMRSWWKLKLSKIQNQILWAFIFIIYPLVFLVVQSPLNISSENIMAETFFFIGMVLLITEVITQPITNRKIESTISKLKIRMSPEWIVIAIFIMLAINMSMQLRMIYGPNSSGFKSGFWIGIQSSFVLSVFYIFYLINHYYLVNNIYKEKGIVYYLFSFLGLVCLFFIPITAMLFYFPGFRTMLQYKAADAWIGPDAPTAFWSLNLNSVLFLMFLSIPITILVQWIGLAGKVSALETEKLDTELNLLKQQINPHFFFNTLNNIYSMSRKNNPHTSEAVLQLSDLMRYVIYQGQENTVPLQQEIKYIEDYIQLQKLRLHQKFDYSFNKNIDSSETEVTPLLFIILIENAFKHGIEIASESSYLHITLEQSERGITFSSTNSIEEDLAKSNPGLGLQNLRRRLELSYPDAYTLNINQTKQEYQVILHLDI